MKSKANASKESKLNTKIIPQPIWATIFSFLTPSEVGRARRINNHLHTALSENNIWQPRLLARLPKFPRLSNVSYQVVYQNFQQFSWRNFVNFVEIKLQQKISQPIKIALESEKRLYEEQKQNFENNKQAQISQLGAQTVQDFKREAAKIVKQYINVDRSDNTHLIGKYFLKRIFSFLFPKVKINLDKFIFLSEEDKQDLKYFNRGQIEFERAQVYFTVLNEINAVDSVKGIREFLDKLTKLPQQKVGNGNFQQRLIQCYQYSSGLLNQFYSKARKMQNIKFDTFEEIKVTSQIKKQHTFKTHSKLDSVENFIRHEFVQFKSQWEKTHADLVKKYDALVDLYYDWQDRNKEITKRNDKAWRDYYDAKEVCSNLGGRSNPEIPEDVQLVSEDVIRAQCEKINKQINDLGPDVEIYKAIIEAENDKQRQLQLLQKNCPVSFDLCMQEIKTLLPKYMTEYLVQGAEFKKTSVEYKPEIDSADSGSGLTY